jgi:hypothetical protein
MNLVSPIHEFLVLMNTILQFELLTDLKEFVEHKWSEKEAEGRVVPYAIQHLFGVRVIVILSLVKTLEA